MLRDAYSACPSWTWLFCSARMSTRWVLHWLMKCSTRSPAPLLNIPAEAADKPRDWITAKMTEGYTTSLFIPITSLHHWFSTPLLLQRWPLQSSRVRVRTPAQWWGSEPAAAPQSHNPPPVHRPDPDNWYTGTRILTSYLDEQTNNKTSTNCIWYEFHK